MSGGDAGHREFRELAAGYALNALDPADEERFLEHMAACPDCLEQIAQFQEVAAALAETAPAAEPSGDLGQRIMAATRPGPAETDPAGTEPAPAGGLTQAGPAADGRAESGPRPVPAGPVPSDAVPSDAVPSDAVPSDAVPSDAVPSDAVPPEAKPPEAVPADVVPLRPGRRRLRRAAAAVAAAVVVGGGIWGGLAATSGGTPVPLAACSRPHACTEVPLVATASHQVAAKVVVKGHEVWMLPGAMTANPKDEIYVLWQIAGNQAPRAVGSFTITAKSRAPIMIGGLAAPYPGTTAFAVSLEHGQTIPAAPSNKLAIGQVS